MHAQGYQGEEAAMQSAFLKARQLSPCVVCTGRSKYLVEKLKHYSVDIGGPRQFDQRSEPIVFPQPA